MDSKPPKSPYLELLGPPHSINERISLHRLLLRLKEGRGATHDHASLETMADL